MKNREVIDRAIAEMLDANVIRRSRSHWSFPVDKNDDSKRFCVYAVLLMWIIFVVYALCLSCFRVLFLVVRQSSKV